MIKKNEITKQPTNAITPASPKALPTRLITEVSPKESALLEKTRPIIEPGRPKSAHTNVEPKAPAPTAISPLVAAAIKNINTYKVENIAITKPSIESAMPTILVAKLGFGVGAI